MNNIKQIYTIKPNPTETKPHNPGSKPDITILCPGMNFSMHFIQSFADTISTLKDQNITHKYRFGHTSSVYSVRDSILGGDPKKGKKQLPNIDTKYILWIDSDCVWKPSDVIEILQIAENNPTFTMITAWCVVRDGFTSPFIVDEKGIRSSDITIQEELCERSVKITTQMWDTLPDLTRIRFSGGHFLLMRTEIFKELEYPWFSPILFSNYGIDNLYAGEDVSMSHRVRKAGGSIWLAKNIKVGHEKNNILY